MAKGANILELGPAVTTATAEFINAVPQGFHFEQIADQPAVVDHAVNEFVRSFIEALAIVLFVSFLALGWRTGFVVALSVPLVLAVVFVVMNAIGLDLHRITLGALIIALGLLVDDAIIAVEMMVVKMELGWDRVRAASFAWESTAFPMLTELWCRPPAFFRSALPIPRWENMPGGIFWVVAIALVASWIVAVVFIPYIGVKLLPSVKPLSPGQDPHAICPKRGFIVACVASSNGASGGAVLSWSRQLASLCSRSLRSVACSSSSFRCRERPELFFQLRMPAGTAFGATLKSVKRAEALLEGDDDIATYTAYVGRGSPRFWLRGSIRSFRMKHSPRSWSCRRTSKRGSGVRGAAGKGGGGWRVVRSPRACRPLPNLGPPVGFPVQFRVIGPDTKKVREIAYQVREVMRGNEQVIDPHLDWNEQAPYLKLIVDQGSSLGDGVDAFQDISQSLSMLISRLPITTVRDGIEKVAVVARAVPSERLNLAHKLAIYRSTRATGWRFRSRKSPTSNTPTRSRSCGE